MLNEITQSWLSLQCQMIPHVRRAILILTAVTDHSIAPAASWPTDEQDTTLLLESGKLALKKKGPLIQRRTDPKANQNVPQYVIACPMFQNDQLFAVVVLEIKTLDKAMLRTILQLLKWGSAWLQLLSQINGESAIAARLATVIEVTAKSLAPMSMQAAATTVVTHLGQLLACDRVSFGLLHSRHIRVQAVSHSAHIDRRSGLIRGIEAAMDESLDLGTSLAYPPECMNISIGIPAHQRLCDGQEGAALTVMLSNAGKVVGALTFERRRGPAFDDSTIDVCEAIASLIGPIFEMKRLQDRPLLEKAGNAFTGILGKQMGWGNLRRKLTIICLLGFGIWFSLSTTIYRISAAATLEGTEQRALVAPIEGYVERAMARAGELVKKGDVIATLDDRDLVLERRRWASERDDLNKKLDRAIGGFDRAEATIIEAQLGKANAQLELIEEQLARMQIIAPFDGIIISGDLSRALGAPVERGQILFEIAPLDAYRMALQVTETDIAHIEQGQRGYLALAAMPGERLSFIIDDIIGIALTDEGKNGFRVEARLEGAANQLRPGMRGVGKIEIDERSQMWIWGHTLFDHISLWLWAHLP